MQHLKLSELVPVGSKLAQTLANDRGCLYYHLAKFQHKPTKPALGKVTEPRKCIGFCAGGERTGWMQHLEFSELLPVGSKLAQTLANDRGGKGSAQTDKTSSGNGG